MNRHHRNKISTRTACVPVAKESGFALYTTLVIVLVVGIVAVSSMRSTVLTEVMAGNSIQRSRAFQAAEGGIYAGEQNSIDMIKQRIFSSPTASEGVYSFGSVNAHWWREDASSTVTNTLAVDAFPGVVSPPVYVVEEVGSFVADGGSGIVSLDRGAASYGRRTGSGREVVLYRLQSNGVGSTDTAQAVVESLYVKSQ